MTEQEQLGYAMRVAHAMSQSFLKVIGEEPGPELEDMPPEQQQAIAEIVATCRTSKGFREVLKRATSKANFANRPDDMQGLLLINAARLGWMDVMMVTEAGGSA